MKILANIPSFWKLIIAIIVCESVGIASGLLVQADIYTWFATLNKPLWSPPPYLYGWVWTFLYFLMGIAWWLILESNAPERQKKAATLLFVLQLFLNFGWPIIFFKFHLPALAFTEIIFMLVAILLTTYRFAGISRLAAWVLVPYISWVYFAAILNYTIWTMNE